MAASSALHPAVAEVLRAGGVFPAHPLALTESRRLDERRQAALTRYYCEAGVSGIAVGVHTTQFAIRDPGVALLEPVLGVAAEVARGYERESGRRLVKIAGICGETAQAMREAGLAREAGYDIGLLSLAALPRATDGELLAHCRAVGEQIPLCGFYLQPSVGGRALSADFWRRFCEIEAVVAIKAAPFNRYHTVDVARGIAESGRAGDIALYTGNDDNIVADLLSDFNFPAGRVPVRGGLLGQWAVWTRRAVELMEAVRACRAGEGPLARELLACGAALTDANGALFDVRNGFAGCIAGLHEVLRRQGLLQGRWCLDPAEDLSPGQAEEIDRVLAAYPQLTDDEFVAAHRDRWLAR